HLPRLIPGFSYLYARSNEPNFGVGLFNQWHATIRPQLKEAEAFVLPYLDGTNTIIELRTRLRDALQQGKVAGTDGRLLKGQRNLDAKAQEILNKLLDVLKRSGVLLT